MSMQPTFDHAECRELYATGNYTQSELGRRYGVTPTRIGQIVNLSRKRRIDKAAGEWNKAHYHQPCRECGATIWKYGNASRSGLCQKCWGVTQRTAKHGTESRYSFGCRCGECRQAATDAKRRRRERSRVPCSHGCGRLVDGINRRNPSKPPECRPCAMARVWAEKARQVAA